MRYCEVMDLEVSIALLDYVHFVLFHFSNPRCQIFDLFMVNKTVALVETKERRSRDNFYPTKYNQREKKAV